MTERRFSLLKKLLHFVNNDEIDHKNKLRKINNIIDRVNEVFETVYTPERDVSIDESLILFKGRLSWKQYIPNKRSRFGIKLFKNHPMTTQVVLTLAKPLLNFGYCLVMDNFYTSPALCQILQEHKTDTFGTLRKNRKNLPAELNNKLKPGETAVFHKNCVNVIKWCDKKDVLMISTIHNGELSTQTIKNKIVTNT